MHFVGSDLLRLVEEVLPDRFGGIRRIINFSKRRKGGWRKSASW